MIIQKEWNSQSSWISRKKKICKQKFRFMQGSTNSKFVLSCGVKVKSQTEIFHWTFNSEYVQSIVTLLPDILIQKYVLFISIISISSWLFISSVVFTFTTASDLFMCIFRPHCLPVQGSNRNRQCGLTRADNIAACILPVGLNSKCQ